MNTTHSLESFGAALRTELADLAFDLERQGRCDAADVVMMLDARVCEMIGAMGERPTGACSGAGGDAPRGVR